MDNKKQSTQTTALDTSLRPTELRPSPARSSNPEILLHCLPGTQNISVAYISASTAYSQFRPFRLPYDTERLCLSAASIGMRSAVQAGPTWLERREIEQEALSICLCTRRSCPEVTNDYAAYRQAFIEAYTLGYRATRESIYTLPAQLREEVATSVRLLSIDRVLAFYVTMLQALLQEHNLESIYDLLLHTIT